MSGSTSAGSSAAQSAAWRTGLGVLTEATGTDRAGNIRTADPLRNFADFGMIMHRHLYSRSFFFHMYILP